MKNTKRITILLLMAMMLLVSGCNNESVAQEEEVVVEREQLELHFDELSFDVDKEEMTIGFTTYFPEDTVVERVMLVDSEEEIVLEVDDVSITDGNTVVIVEVDEMERENFPEDDFTLVLKIKVNEEANSYLLTDEAFGGSFSEMQLEYAESESVFLSASNELNAYSIEIRSETQLELPEEFYVIVEEEEVEEEEVVVVSVEEEVEVVEEETVEETSPSSEFQLVSATDIKQKYDNLWGEKIEVHGEITQVIQYDPYALTENAKSFLVNISEPGNYNSDNSVWVEVLENAPTVVEGTKVIVRGTLMDTYSYESVSGTNITVPYIMSYYMSAK